MAHANAVRQLAAASRYRMTAMPPGLVPLILCGRGDRLVDPRCSHALAQHWHTQAREHPWAGHDLSHDDPDWLLDELADYVNTQKKAPFGADAGGECTRPTRMRGLVSGRVYNTWAAIQPKTISGIL
ncbi:hypothetical protein MBH78_00190 [Oceanimonas sp. NS1]|nr:hypothetical protein [Oceanimonas sp. NS1]